MPTLSLPLRARANEGAERRREGRKKKTKTLEFNYSPSLPPPQITMERRNRARERKGRNDRDRVILYFEQPRFFFPFSVLTAVKDSPSVCFFSFLPLEREREDCEKREKREETVGTVVIYR